MVSKAQHGWWIHKDKQQDIQGLVGKSFKALDYSEALFLNLSGARNKNWLARLDSVVEITSGTVSEEADRAAALAFTYEGLILSGLPRDAADQFDLPFREGMTERNRSRRLGDFAYQDETKDTLKWIWSGDTKTAQHEVHVLLLLYAKDAEDLKNWKAKTKRVLKSCGCDVPYALNLTMLKSSGDSPSDQKMTEHFGFVDGVSQPIPNDDFWDDKDNPADGGAKPDDAYQRKAFEFGAAGKPSENTLRYHGIPTGDVLLGRPDSYRELQPSPFLQANGANVAATLGDQQGSAPIGFRDFGYDGSFLVVRQLKQDVAGFWQHVRDHGETLGASGEDVAAKMMGRHLNGDMLLPPETDEEEEKTGVLGKVKNVWRSAQGKKDIPAGEGFAKTDPHGYGCPFGSHVRRANPRDSGATSDAEILSNLGSVNNHRVLRRGRPYGPEMKDRFKEDGKDRGLLFVCLNTDITRQFEFIQETWLLSRPFAELHETDPILGPSGAYTLQDKPVRRKIDVSTFVHPVGGEYFFLPSLKAIDYLRANLAGNPPSKKNPPSRKANRDAT